MERIIGDTATTAYWAVEASSEQDPWGRLSTALKECLFIDEWILSEDHHKMSWIADTLAITAEYRDAEPFSFLRVSVQVFNQFESPMDGIFLANALNHKATGGAFLYNHRTESVEFVCYCAIQVWWDFALLLNSLRTSIGQCETLSRRESVLRYNKCKSATTPHPSKGVRTSEHLLYTARLDDVSEIDFIGGLYIADRERDQVFDFINEECNDIEFQPNWDEEALERTIDKMDFSFQLFPPEDCDSVLNEFSAFASIRFNEWTDYGRAISVNLGLPLFTWNGLFDDGATHEDAAELANLLNFAAAETCWQKVGLGCWWAKGSQICFSMDIPHTWLKPVVINTYAPSVAETIFDVVNPKMLQRMFNIAIREMKSIDVTTKRDPEQMDDHKSIIHHRRRIEPLRCHDDSASSNTALDSYWDMPSRPIFIYGVFNPVGSTLGSIELVNTKDELLLAYRYRHHTGDYELILDSLTDHEPWEPAITKGISDLASQISLPDFIHIPSGISTKISDAVHEGLSALAREFLLSGVDLTLKAARISSQPNPWWRKGTSAPRTDTDDLSGFENSDPVDAYLEMASHPFVVDVNLGLFHAWWAGAQTWVREPDNPDEATRVVESLTRHVIIRQTGDVA